MPAADLDESALYSLVRRETGDADEQAACLRDWGQIYEQLAPGRFEGRFVQVCFGGMQLFREVTNQPLYEAGLVRDDEHVLGVPVAMQGQGHCGGQPILPDSVMSICGGGELDCRTPDRFDVVAVAVPQAALARYAREVEHDDDALAPARAGVLYPDKARTDALRALLLAVLERLSRQPALLRHQAVQHSLADALLASIVAALGPGAATAAPPPPLGSRHALVRRAQACMREHPDEPLTIEDLCRALGTSRRTLQYSFQDVLQLNPVRYLRALRLNGVRRTLRRAEAATSVHDTAARWGFWHMSHFADDYRQMFGELPSQTLREATGAG